MPRGRRVRGPGDTGSRRGNDVDGRRDVYADYLPFEFDADHIDIVPAMPGEYPAPGTVPNGDAEGSGGWTFTTYAGSANGTVEADIVDGVGADGSRGVTLAARDREPGALLARAVSARRLRDGNGMHETEAEFLARVATLTAHLVEVRPIFDAFCERHGFEYVVEGLGRYPRIRIKRDDGTDGVELAFDLWMETDEQGHRFKTFERDRPYELSCGACMLAPDDGKHRTRLQHYVHVFRGVPFERVVQTVEQEMEGYMPLLSSWDANFLVEYGTRVPLR